MLPNFHNKFLELLHQLLVTIVASLTNQPVHIVDETGSYAARIGSDGRMFTSSAVTAPTGTTAVSVSAIGDVNTTADTYYTITSGKTLTIQRLEGGAEEGGRGCKVEIFEDPNGDASVLTLISIFYCQYNSFCIDLLRSFVGNGTRRILLRRTAFGTGLREIFGRWIGYEE